MSVKPQPIKIQKCKTEDEFIEGIKSDDEDIVMISLRLEKKYLRRIEKLISEKNLISRNTWIKIAVLNGIEKDEV